jgi:hypothetical protein
MNLTGIKTLIWQASMGFRTKRKELLVEPLTEE